MPEVSRECNDGRAVFECGLSNLLQANKGEERLEPQFEAGVKVESAVSSGFASFLMIIYGYTGNYQ